MMGKDQGKGTWKKPESWRELAAAGEAGAKVEVYTGPLNTVKNNVGRPKPSRMRYWVDDQTKPVVDLSTPGGYEARPIRQALKESWAEVRALRLEIARRDERNVLFAHALEQILRAVSHGQYEQQKVIRQLAEYQVKETENG